MPLFMMLYPPGTLSVFFQLESEGMRRILREMAPSRFEDIIAVNALYRPGPLGSGMVEDFLNCKHGRQEIEYIHPQLANILQETYGVVLYQEQVMQIAAEIADFTMAEADGLRRAMGKKKVSELMAQRNKFVQGAASNGVERTAAEKLFDIMESFAGYGFNKSHAAAYALITYQTVYLKVHYPVEYMCAFLSSVIDNQDKVVFYLKECRRMGIHVLPPDINESYENFTVTRTSIRFGLGAIKNVGLNAVSNIASIRKKGPFTSLFDFCRRVDLGQINKRMMENLIAAGCFDSLGITRKQALSIMEECMDIANRIKASEASHQMSLFGGVDEIVEEPRPSVRGEFSAREKLNREKDVLGFYVSANPLDEFQHVLPYLTGIQIADLSAGDEETYVRLTGMVVNLTKKISRRGEPYARFYLEDGSGRIEVLAFPSALKKNADLHSGRYCSVGGRVFIILMMRSPRFHYSRPGRYQRN